MSSITALSGTMNKDRTMKKISVIVALSAVLVISCSKEETTLETKENRVVSIDGYIDDDLDIDTKTDYLIAGSTASFRWKGTEEFDRLYVTTANGNFGYKTFSGEAGDSGLTEISFTGEEITDGTDLEFATYPKKGASNNAGLDRWSSGVYFQLKESINYDKDAPLANIVPMVGKLDGGKFVFKVASGIIAIRMTNIPSSATKLTISSSDVYLSGGFRYTASGDVTYADELSDIYDYGFQLTAPKSGDVYKTKTFSFSSLESGEEYVFYYPIPVGTITGGLTITLYNGSTPLYSAKTSQNLSSVRGQITRLPLITVRTAASASVSGDLNSRTANFTYNDATSIKYALSTSSTATLSSLTPIETTNTSEALSPSATGTYYLVYQGYVGTKKIGPEQRVRFLYASDDVSQVAGTYSINGNSNWRFKIEAVDPAVDGNNIKISTYYSTNANYNEVTGNCYGVYTASDGTVAITSGQTLTKAETTYYLVGTSESNFKSGVATSYKSTFELALQEVENNAGIWFDCDHFSVATSIDTGASTFISGGQHWSNGTPYLYKAN